MVCGRGRDMGKNRVINIQRGHESRAEIVGVASDTIEIRKPACVGKYSSQRHDLSKCFCIMYQRHIPLEARALNATLQTSPADHKECHELEKPPVLSLWHHFHMVFEGTINLPLG